MLDKKYVWIILGIFLILGIYIRVQYIDFPNIQYHNMKLNEYYAETLFMQQNHDFLNRYTWMFFGLTDNHHFDEYPEAPVLSWLTLPIWLFTGPQLWVMRAIIIAFMMGAIILTYFIVKQFTESEYLALISSFLITIMPLGIFFGQNVQPDIPAMACCLLAIFFFNKWIEKDFKKHRWIFFSMLAVSMAGIFKMTFMIILIPLFFLIPFKKFFNMPIKKIWNHTGIALMGLMPFALMIKIMNDLIVDKSRVQVESFVIAFKRALDITFWQKTLPSLISYINDNFTMILFIFAIIGLCMAIYKYKTQFGRFAIGNIVAILIYLGICSGKIGGHSFYQIPFLPFICIMVAYFIFTIGMFLNQFIKWKYVKYIPLILLVVAIPSVQQSNDRVFGTLFYGGDIAGSWIKEHTNSNERFFIYGHSQTFSSCTVAQRYCGDVYNLTLFKETEQKYGIRYLEFDNYGGSMLQTVPDTWNYIQNNYKIVWIGLIPINGQLTISDVILEKGGKFNISDVQNNQPYLIKTYDTPYGGIPYYVVKTE